MKYIRKYIICNFLFLFLCLAKLNLYAQSFSHLWAGGYAGIDIRNIHFNPTPPNLTIHSDVGFTIGGELNYFVSDNSGICFQVSYVQKGVKIEELDLPNSNYSTTTLSYLQIPILYKMLIGSGKLKPFLFMGPEIGFKLFAKQHDVFIKNGIDTAYVIPDSELTSINVGIMGGVGIIYSINPSMIFFLDAAYDYGITNTLPTRMVDEQKAFTHDYRITLGIIFAIRKSGD